MKAEGPPLGALSKERVVADPKTAVTALVVGAPDPLAVRLAEALTASGLATVCAVVPTLADLAGKLAEGCRTTPLPDIVFLSHDIPDGWAPALAWIKSQRATATASVVVVTTSASSPDMGAVLAAGAVALLRDPPSFEGLVDIMLHLGAYWLEAG
jgi:CheY-like chemotaxis protein